MLASICVAPFAYAQSSSKETSLLTFGVGHYDALDDHEGVDFRLEYRPNKHIVLDNLKPWAGGEVTSEGTLWIGGGVLYDYNVAPNWHLTPSIGVGIYDKGGSDVDLDHPLQVRSQLELSYAFEGQSRIGMSLSHLSNANLGDSNPGAEVVNIQYSLPISTFFSKKSEKAYSRSH